MRDVLFGVHPRYSDPIMNVHWSREEFFDTYRLILSSNALARGAPDDVVRRIAEADLPSAQAVDELESLVGGHEVVSFLTLFSGGMPDEVACWVHLGMTSSDLTDTAMAVAASGSTIHTAGLMMAVEYALIGLAKRSRRSEDVRTARSAVTHARVAVDTSLDHQIDVIRTRLVSVASRLVSSAASCLNSMSSGPAGDDPVDLNIGMPGSCDCSICETTLDRAVDSDGMKVSAPPFWTLSPASATGQAADRLILSEWISAMAACATLAESVAQFVWDGVSTGEFLLASDSGSTSSSMPHKSNPTRAERIWGLARTVRAMSGACAESSVMRFDRDISQTSVERICLPQICSYTGFALIESVTLLESVTADLGQMDRRMAENRHDLRSHDRLVAAMTDGMSYLDARDAARRV